MKQSSCVDCGIDDPIVLDFDHVRGVKEFSISDAIRTNKSYERITAEIQKCEIRCANCHRKRHAHVNKWYDFSLIEKPSTPLGKERWHGTKNGYSYHKCRCTSCTEAHKQYQRQYRKQIGPVV